MKDLIDYYKNIPLSGDQMLKLVNGKANIVLYSDLHNYDDIDDVLGPYKTVFLLFETKSRVGHWTCLCFKEGVLHFFNSYSGYPDDGLKYIDDEFRDVSNQDLPYLSELMYNSPYELAYNEHKFQGNNNNIMTCGRWCALFVLMKDMTLDTFAKLFNNKYGDDIVTLLTMYINF